MQVRFIKEHKFLVMSFLDVGFLILALFLGIKCKILLLTVGLYYHKLIVKTSRKYLSSLDIFTFLHDQVCSTCLIKFQIRFCHKIPLGRFMLDVVSNSAANQLINFHYHLLTKNYIFQQIVSQI